MMFDSLTSDAWMYMVISLVVASVCFAWAADSILGQIGFGVIGTSIIAVACGYGGLMATDWAIRHQKLPYEYSTPLVYVSGAAICVTAALIVLCFLKRLVFR